MYKLVGAPVSLYTGKVRAYLHYKKIPFQEVLSTPEIYRDLIIPRTGLRMIPVLVTPDDQVIQDTTDIIDHLENVFPENSIYPSTPCQRLVALLMEVYGDEWLVNPAMLYRWGFEENREFAIREFGKVAAPNASEEEQYAIGLKNSVPFAGALPRLGITDHSRPALEQSYVELLGELNAHFAPHDYLLGAKPCIGDYGLIGPLYAHLYRDPYSGRLMEEKAPHLARWVRRMIDPASPTNDGGEKSPTYLADDQVPTTLLPIIARMFREQVPVILETAEQLATWVVENPDREISRVIGSLRYKVGAIEEERLVFPYNQWMWQRPHEFYHSLSGPDKAAVDELLTPSQAEALNTPLKVRLRRRNNKLVAV